MNGCRLSGDLCLPILLYTLVVSKKCEITGGVICETEFDRNRIYPG